MKIRTIFLMLVAIFISSMAYSQTNKGNWVVSGNTTLQVVNSKPEKGDGGTTTVVLSPSVGYFIIDNLSLGLELNLLSTEGSTTISALPTATYYFETKSQLKPFVGLGVGYSNVKINDNNYGGLALGAGGGIVYLLNQHVGLDVGLQYLRNDYDGGVVNSFGGAIGFSIFF